MASRKREVNKEEDNSEEGHSFENGATIEVDRPANTEQNEIRENGEGDD